MLHCALERRIPHIQVSVVPGCCIGKVGSLGFRSIFFHKASGSTVVEHGIRFFGYRPLPSSGTFAWSGTFSLEAMFSRKSNTHFLPEARCMLFRRVRSINSWQECVD